MKDWYAISTESSALTGRLYGKCVIEMHVVSGTVILSGITSLERSRGHCSAALRAVLELADRHGMKLRLHAQKFGSSGSLTTAQLKRWYKRHGFKPEKKGSPIMIREANSTSRST